MTSMPALRSYYANLIAGNAGVRDHRIVAALETVPREQFVGPGPWMVYTLGGGYVETPSDDPAFLYQDVLVAISKDRGLNNGSPSLHARCLVTLKPAAGEAALHIGAGTGYYTALLAELVGPDGSVAAYEIEDDLADRAAANLKGMPHVRVHNLSGCDANLDACDVIYVNAGATHPLDAWLDALRPKGRLLFPLTPDEGMGGMLLITRGDDRRFSARFVSLAMFVPCQGARDRAMAQRLAEAFARGDMWSVRSFHRGTVPDGTCWCSGTNWWLSVA
jgi:protein-L-isoaspartate(D-aspartate) O-methyltransferase